MGLFTRGPTAAEMAVTICRLKGEALALRLAVEVLVEELADAKEFRRNLAIRYSALRQGLLRDGAPLVAEGLEECTAALVDDAARSL